MVKAASRRPPAPAIMTSAHPRINEFLERLAGPDGVDLTHDFDLSAAHLGACKGKPACPRSRVVLAGMGLSAAAIEQSLLFFQIAELDCDCAVLAGVLSADVPYECEIADQREVVSSPLR